MWVPLFVGNFDNINQCATNQTNNSKMFKGEKEKRYTLANIFGNCAKWWGIHKNNYKVITILPMEVHCGVDTSWGECCGMRTFLFGIGQQDIVWHSSSRTT